MAERAADVLIVGGGIMGAATAFFLRRRGRSVILVERDLVGQQASGVNFGNVRRQGRALSELPLANRSRAIWGRLPELIGEDVEFLPSGHIRICYTAPQADALETYAREAKARDLDLELISGNALHRRFPFFGPEVLAGSYSPHDGHANPRLAAPAFARAAARAGAVVLERTEITAIEKSGEDFRLASAQGVEFRAPVVLVSAGAWGDALARRFGEPVPLVARGPQMAVTEPVPYEIEPVLGLSTAVVEEGIYMRQIPRGNLIFGGGNRGPAFADIRRAYVLPGNTLNQFRQLRRLVPAVSRLRIIRVWSGIESYLPDELPILGPSARVSGLHYAFGFCGHGFQLGPGVGDLMAELIDTGTTATPHDAFSIARFAAASGARHAGA